MKRTVAEYLEGVVHDEEGHSRGLGVAAVEEGDVAALPAHLREVHAVYGQDLISHVQLTALCRRTA